MSDPGIRRLPCPSAGSHGSRAGAACLNSNYGASSRPISSRFLTSPNHILVSSTQASAKSPKSASLTTPRAAHRKIMPQNRLHHLARCSLRRLQAFSGPAARPPSRSPIISLHFRHFLHLTLIFISLISVSKLY